jgi:methyl-accepting chemotaxis protein
MNERQGKNGGESAALHDALYQRITSSTEGAIKIALGLVDEADKAAQKMVAECETLLEAVRQGTEQIRSDLREKMVEFATVMRDYSETIAAKNTAYVEATSKTIDVISSHIETVRAAMKAVAPEVRQLPRPTPASGQDQQDHSRHR